MTVTLADDLASLSLVGMSQLRDELRVLLRSPSAAGSVHGTTKLTDAEAYTVVQRAIREVSQSVWLEGWYEGIDLRQGERDYQLPAWLEKVKRVQRRHGSVVVNLSGVLDQGDWIDIREWTHTYTQESNLLRLEYLYSDQVDTRILYERRLPVPPQPSTLQASMTAAQTTMDVLSPWTFPVPGYVLVGAEAIKVEDQDPSSATAGTLGSLTRGVLGTFAVAHTSGDTVDPMLEAWPNVRQAIMIGAEYFFHRMRLNDGPSQSLSQTQTNLQWLEKEWRKAKNGLAGRRGGEQPPVRRSLNPRRRRSLLTYG